MSVERGQESVVASLARSEVIDRWLEERPQVSILPMRNQDGIRAAVGDPLLAAIERWLVANHATVVARDRQGQMICEIVRQADNAFDPRFRAQLGRQLGSKWFVTGTVTPVKRYWDFHSMEGGWVDRSTIVVSIIEAETSRVLWEDHLPLVAHSTERDGIEPGSAQQCRPRDVRERWQRRERGSRRRLCARKDDRGMREEVVQRGARPAVLRPSADHDAALRAEPLGHSTDCQKSLTSSIE